MYIIGLRVRGIYELRMPTPAWVVFTSIYYDIILLEHKYHIADVGKMVGNKKASG